MFPDNDPDLSLDDKPKENDATLEELDAARDKFDQWKADKYAVENPLDPQDKDDFGWIVGPDYEFHDSLAFVDNDFLGSRVRACAIVAYRDLYDAGKIAGEYDEDKYMAGIENHLAYVNVQVRILRDKAQLALVITAAGAAKKYKLAEPTVRQYLNRNRPWWARKDAGTWLVLASIAENVWGRK